MRIDTLIPDSSAKFLYVDIPYRYAYRHIKVAMSSGTGISLAERVVHIALTVILAIPVIGMIAALAERILFPAKAVEKATKEEVTEIVIELVEEKIEAKPAPMKLKRRSTMERRRSTLDNRSMLNLMEEVVNIESLTPDLIRGYANLGKFWTLLDRSKKEVANRFSVQDFRVLLENADVATMPLRSTILAGIIECIPANQDSDLEKKLQLFSTVATEEMEMVLTMKMAELNRWYRSKSLKPAKKLTKLIRKSIGEAKQLREETKGERERLSRASSERTFKHEIKKVVHGKPINLGAMRREIPRMTNEEFLKDLDAKKVCEDDFFMNLLAKYDEGSKSTKEKILEVMRLALSEQSTTNSMLEQTLKMLPKDIGSFVHLLNEISPEKVIVLWGQLIKNSSAFLGEEGQAANKLRLRATLEELSMEQLKASIDNHKFKTLLEDHAAIAAESLSFDQLDLVTETASSEVLAKLIPGLQDDDERLYDKLKVMCKIFPTVISDLNKQLAEQEAKLKGMKEDSLDYKKVLEKIAEINSQMLTMERVLKGKILKIEDFKQREELTSVLAEAEELMMKFIR